MAGPGAGGPGGRGGAPLEGSLLQPLDHFDRLERRSLRQRYWISREFWQQPGGPVFLLLGGESGLAPGVLSRGHVVELGRAHGALLAALEHRFYGGSRGPGGDPDLRFLSSQQALADLATFRLHVTSAWGLSPNHTWVCFGGSYAGALAAWARLKFPHLISAAVASSAPIRAQVDFAGYNHVVSAALADPTVGGSPECLRAVAAAFAALDGRLRGRRLAGVARDFSSCRPPREPGDRELLAENVADVFAGAVQYNGYRPADSVAALCRAMTDGHRGSPYRRLVAVNKELRRPKAGGSRRLWLFQTCTEFGFYPSCRDAACPFSRFQTLRAQLSLCADVFGIAPARVRAAVAFTNAFYGAAHPGTHRVLFVNGALDPWHVLSAAGGRGGLLIAGASHCADMAPPRPGDPPALRAARQGTQACVPRTPVSAPTPVPSPRPL
ncbi:thymus-specific serine protease [Pelecanus crispus]|uniref:thymus-specific serine protease n=1 Tax=Pelecanus crispus TaxID=36300 RepID=UPI003F5D0D6E